MKELGMSLGACGIIVGFISLLIYPDIEVKNQPSNRSCIDECHIAYVEKYGNTVDILRAQQAAAAGDPFSEIRGLWAGCAACHGQQGEGIAVFPKLAGQSADYIIGRLNTYKAKGEVGSMSSTMWAQAGMLSDKDIQTIGDFIATELK